MAINFPNSPVTNDTFTVGSQTFIYDGTKWIVDSFVGYTGSQGTTGFTGSAGTTGFTGSQGSIGFTGSAGTTGFTGSQGTTGFTGSIGSIPDVAYTTGSVTISSGTGSKSLFGMGTDTGFGGSANNFAVGSYVKITLTSNTNTYLTGTITSINTTFVNINVDYSTLGSNIQSSWNVTYQGFKGDLGYTGSAGTTGFTGSQGTTGFTGSAGPVAGTDSQLIYNNGGVAGGTTDITFDDTNNDLRFADNAKAVFGNGTDLQIYHTGTASRIESSSTHSLFIRNFSNSENYIVCVPNNEVSLYHNGASKLLTAADGISVTGNIAVTGTVDGRDVASDGTKLDGIESGANVTDAGNVNPLIDAHLNTSTATSSQVLSWTGTDYDWVAQSGGGGALNDLTDVAITSVADGDLIRYNGTAGEWQNTNLGLTVTPTLSAPASTIYFGGYIEITNWGSYANPSMFAEVKNSSGTVVVSNANISKDLDSGILYFDRPSATGSGYYVEVQVQDFGDLASEVATSSTFTVSNASYRYWRINSNFTSAGLYVYELELFTGSGQTGTEWPTSNMTANNAPTPFVASAQGTYSTTTYDPWKAFDGSTGTGWWNLLSSTPTTDYLQIDLGSSQTIPSLRMRLLSGATVSEVSISGSNTGAFSGEQVEVFRTPDTLDKNLALFEPTSGVIIYNLG